MASSQAEGTCYIQMAVEGLALRSRVVVGCRKRRDLEACMNCSGQADAQIQIETRNCLDVVRLALVMETCYSWRLQSGIDEALLFLRVSWCVQNTYEG